MGASYLMVAPLATIEGRCTSIADPHFAKPRSTGSPKYIDGEWVSKPQQLFACGTKAKSSPIPRFTRGGR